MTFDIQKLFLPEPPKSPYTYIVPICLVMGLTALKQVCYHFLAFNCIERKYPQFCVFNKGFEDVKRHLSDRTTNNMPTSLWRGDKFVKAKWGEIKVAFKLAKKLFLRYI